MVASVSPTLGKINAHQLRLYLIFLQSRTMLRVVRPKNQKASSHKNIPATAPMTLMVSAADAFEVAPRKWTGKPWDALLLSEIRPTIV